MREVATQTTSIEDDWPYPYPNNQDNQLHNNIQNNNKNKWVINISNKPLTTDEERLLAHGPNYAIVPKDPPIVQQWECSLTAVQLKWDPSVHHAFTQSVTTSLDLTTSHALTEITQHIR